MSGIYTTVYLPRIHYPLDVCTRCDGAPCSTMVARAQTHAYSAQPDTHVQSRHFNDSHDLHDVQ